jgi:hypothetical protein
VICILASSGRDEWCAAVRQVRRLHPPNCYAHCLIFFCTQLAAAAEKVDQLIALCEKEKPLSASDVAAIRQLLAAGAGVVNGKGVMK